jgi:hypothetical protein
VSQICEIFEYIKERNETKIDNHIEELQRDFLWDRVGEEIKFHLFSWSKICTPIFLSGLGVQNMLLFNQALLGKWLLQICHTQRGFVEIGGGS